MSGKTTVEYTVKSDRRGVCVGEQGVELLARVANLEMHCHHVVVHYSMQAPSDCPYKDQRGQSSQLEDPSSDPPVHVPVVACHWSIQ